jgi:hypothetical protein
MVLKKLRGGTPPVAPLFAVLVGRRVGQPQVCDDPQAIYERAKRVLGAHYVPQ